ncbi:hypothetical protein IWW54_000082 [Coemansia sp. RSA 2705]|nr:hypothetical protein IWW54_000082 [Coemansia sp. RSA 2705]
MNRSPWPKLRAVSLFHHFATHAHTARRLDTAEAAYVDQVANTFFRYIPSIAQLNVIAHRADAAMHRFTSTLVCKYAPKLAHLSYTGIAFYSSSPVVLRLKSLDLDFTKIPVAIPLKIDPAALSNLALQNVDSASNLQFFARTNALFTKTKRIRLTRLLLYSDIGSLQWSQAQWPYLTYLGLQNASVALEGVFELVSALSDLRQLKVRRLRMPTTSEFTGAPDTYLQNLRDRYKQPSSAWLQWFAVEFPPPFSPEYLVHTVETVRWYLPRLRHVIIPQDSP